MFEGTIKKAPDGDWQPFAKFWNSKGEEVESYKEAPRASMSSAAVGLL